MAVGPIVVGSTYQWLPSFLRNRAIFDLTGATIVISFLPPTGTAQIFTMSIVSAPAGTATYTNLTTLFSVAGEWFRSYKITVGGIVLESAGIPFKVYPSVSGS
jgi:hypothetical protein